MPDPTAHPTLDAATLRRLAVRASCDPKTIRKVYDGQRVRGLAGHRARTVLSEAGLLPDEPPSAGADDAEGRTP